jgi:diaminopimelate epimerase
MLKTVPFSKYTSFGNSFVIIDESMGPILSEEAKSRFAFQATNEYFGVGSDNLLVIERCTEEVLAKINRSRKYWKTPPRLDCADYVFRMFEPDGSEAFSCGNGLMCVASHLYLRYGIECARVMTEIPVPKPNVVCIGVDREQALGWANLGHPKRVPAELTDRSRSLRFNESIDLLTGIEITNFRQSDALSFFSGEQALNMPGYLVYTGEPHLVIFTDTGYSLNGTTESLFPVIDGPTGPSLGAEKRISSSSALVDFIGKYLGRVYSDPFPAGININFVHHAKSDDALEYRCFERGIHRETLACGTGALAVAFVAHQRNRVHSNWVNLWPYRCRCYDREAQIPVQRTEQGYLLHGAPILLFEGPFGPGNWRREAKAPTGLAALADRSAAHSIPCSLYA